jgi:hypothetical protein
MKRERWWLSKKEKREMPRGQKKKVPFAHPVSLFLFLFSEENTQKYKRERENFPLE